MIQTAITLVLCITLIFAGAEINELEHENAILRAENTLLKAESK